VTLNARDGTPINFERDNTLLRRRDPNRPFYKPQFWEKVQQLDQNGNTEDPGYSCMPLGVPRMGPPNKIVQTPTEMIFLYQVRNTFRVIPTDGRAHTPDKDLEGTWMGESLGHWEGDTFVIDSVGFSDASWLDIAGYFHSEKMHVIERLLVAGAGVTERPAGRGDAWIVSFGVSTLLRSLHVVDSRAAFVVMAAVIAIDTWLLYRFFSRVRMRVVTHAA